MSFSTYEFIFCFFPIVLCIYYVLSKGDKSKKYKLQTLVLLIASSVFITMSGIPALLFVLASAIVNYILLQLIRIKGKKQIMYIGVFLNILFLGYFKYCNFFIDNINTFFHVEFEFHNIILPLGISFYTFQQILLLVEYNKSEKLKIGFLECLSGILFFPRVVSGPIIPLQNMQQQWNQTNHKLDYENLSAGIYLFCIGLFKKVVIADTLVCFVENGYEIANNINFWQAWFTSICYTMQIYFDFSGYSDMAIGIAKTLGIELPINFNSPYHAQSIAEFWRRWHISLSKALSRLIYIPLGGNRKGIVRTCFNLIVTFLVSGLWHGASWNFILWGVMHGIFMVWEKLANKWIVRVPIVIRRIVTFLVVNCLWVLFRADNMSQALQVYKGMLTCPKDFSAISSLSALSNDGIIPFPDILWAFYLILIVVILFIILLKKKNSNDLYREFSPNYRTMVFSVTLFLISVVHLSRLSSFVYVNF